MNNSIKPHLKSRNNNTSIFPKKVRELELTLATQSKIRIELLHNIGFKAKRVIGANICEKKIRQEQNLDYSKRMAITKALTIYHKFPDLPVLAYDTIIYRKNKILFKPNDAKEAKEQIKFLSGCSHRALTSTALVYNRDGNICQIVRSDQTRVKFTVISNSDIDDYIKTNQWQGKSGSYSIYTFGSLFIKQINGLPDVVAGLPCRTTINLLRGNSIL